MSESEIDIHEFKKRFDKLYDEIGGHKITNTVKFIISHEDKEDEYFTVEDSKYSYGIELDSLPGCGCVAGIIINLKKEEN